MSVDDILYSYMKYKTYEVMVVMLAQRCIVTGFHTVESSVSYPFVKDNISSGHVCHVQGLL